MMIAKAKKLFRVFRSEESGATAIEYSLIVGLIFLAIVASVRNFSNTTSDVYGEIQSAIEDTIE